jgi:hypothetical protein
MASLSIAKYVFGQNEMHFLRYAVNQYGIWPLEDRVQAEMQYLRPKTIKKFFIFSE